MNDVPPTSESRLDALVGALRQSEPTLDEVTRARVGADLSSALRDPPPPRTSFLARLFGASSASPDGTRFSSLRLRWLAGGLALAAAASLFLVWRALSVSPVSSPSDPSALAPAPAALAPGRTIDVAAGSTARVAVADADITVYGPGRIETPAVSASGPQTTATLAGASATVDADAVLIDRTHGDGTIALRYASLEMHVAHATFALDRERAPRVTVMRGELLLRCPDNERTVRAGESATCTAEPSTTTTADDPATITASLDSPPVAPSPPSTGGLDFGGNPFDRTATAPPTRGTAGAAAARGDFAGNPFDRTPDAPSEPRQRRVEGPLDSPLARLARGNGSSPSTVTGDRSVTADPSVTVDRYAAADAALRRGDRAAARTALEQVMTSAPTSTDAAAALLDLARLDATTDATTALRHLDTLDAHPRAAVLAEPAAHLRCTLLSGDAHLTCLATFLDRFPHSPRTAATLARLATRRAAANCAAATPLLADYLARFPAGADATAVTAWRDRCAARR